MDPQLKLLPLHFCHDPGANFDWSKLNNKSMTTEPCLEDRLNLIKVYMDIVQLPLSSEAPLINTSVTSRQSSSGSTGSEDGGSLNSGTLKDKKKDGKQNIMAKQFGSLGKSMGKSMGKKLKNLGNNLAPNKAGSKAGAVDGEKGQHASLCGGLTQSTKVITALATTGGGSENNKMVYCAKLSCQYLDSREVFVSNYLKDAEKRFLREQEQKRLKGEELRSWVAPPHPPTMVSQGRTCRTPGCKNCALVDLSLCDRCASQQQWQQGGILDRSLPKGQGQQLGYNTFPGRHKAPTGLPSGIGTSDESYKCGKSKFYTPHPDPPVMPRALQGLHHADRQQSMSTGNVTRLQPDRRPHSPSPDYDNLQYGHEANRKCVTPGCDFYGSKETGYLCSGCHRNKTQPPQLARPEKTTRL